MFRTTNLQNDEQKLYTTLAEAAAAIQLDASEAEWALEEHGEATTDTHRLEEVEVVAVSKHEKAMLEILTDYAAAFDGLQDELSGYAEREMGADPEDEDYEQQFACADRLWTALATFHKV